MVLLPTRLKDATEAQEDATPELYPPNSSSQRVTFI